MVKFIDIPAGGRDTLRVDLLVVLGDWPLAEEYDIR